MLAEPSDLSGRILLYDFPKPVQLLLVSAQLFGAVLTAQILVRLF